MRPMADDVGSCFFPLKVRPTAGAELPCVCERVTDLMQANPSGTRLGRAPQVASALAAGTVARPSGVRVYPRRLRRTESRVAGEAAS